MAARKRIHLGREPEAVVDQLGEARRHAVALVHHLAVQRDRLHGAMGDVQHRTPGRLVDAARLQADEAVLDHVDAPDTVLAGDLVEAVEQLAPGRAPHRRCSRASPASKPMIDLPGLSGASSGAG